MSNDPINPQAKINALVGVLMGMGPMAALSLPRPGFRGVRFVRKGNGKTKHAGSGEGFDVPDKEEAKRICEELDHKRRAEWMKRNLTTHGQRMKAIQAQDIEKSRKLIAQRRKAARAAKRTQQPTPTLTQT